MKMRQTLFATPVRSLIILFVWVALHNSVSPLVLVSGVFFALLLPQLTARFRGPSVQVRSYAKLLRYLLMVLWDIIVANLQVVVIVLGSNRRLKPGFVLVPLDLKEPLPLTMLASTICLTPGTVSADLLPLNSEKPDYLMVHVLDLQDEESLITEIKQRYEAPLLEIFVCSN